MKARRFAWVTLAACLLPAAVGLAQQGDYRKEYQALLLQRSKDQIAPALEALEKMLPTYPDPTHQREMLLLKADLLNRSKKYAECRAECDKFICAYPLEFDACQAAQAQAVEAYRAEGKLAEALGAARILYGAAGSENAIRIAAHVVSNAFRSVDGSLGRANDFLTWQRFGPNGQDGKSGTADDVKANPLLAVAFPPTDGACDKLYADAIAAQPNTYDGQRAKGFLYLYWGKPKEGAKCFLSAFKMCPEPTVAIAAQELILVGMKAHTGSFWGLDKIFEYISYGPKGKSGTENIPDPFAGL
jgi:tetratricopeptide (TPR) repeat protein